MYLEVFFKVRVISILSILVLGLTCALHAEEPSVGGKLKADSVYQTDGIAIHGYDAVAYFQNEKPVKGKKEFEHQWTGAMWRFSSAENRDLFIKEPERYSPQYGGYCAYGMSSGYAAPTRPEAWSVVQGKLYLNYNLEVRKIWEKDRPGHIARADVNWPQIPKKSM